MKWYEMSGALDNFECNPAYLEKVALDTDDNPTIKVVSFNRTEADQPSSSWIKKRKYKKKLVRRFLSVNPDMDYSQSHGTRCNPALYCYYLSCNDGDAYDPKMSYNLNPYTRVFLSVRGDLRKYHGSVYPMRSCYALERKDKSTARMTNRRIRYHALDEETISGCSYSYYKKLFGPLRIGEQFYKK